MQMSAGVLYAIAFGPRGHSSACRCEVATHERASEPLATSGFLRGGWTTQCSLARLAHLESLRSGGSVRQMWAEAPAGPG